MRTTISAQLLVTKNSSSPPEAAVRCWTGQQLTSVLPRLIAQWASASGVNISHHPAWLTVLKDGLQHRPFLLEVEREGTTVGHLALSFVQSRLFGRFLVSLPYLNSAGIRAADSQVAAKLVDRAVQIADELDVRYLELRHETHLEHPALTQQLTNKVHMRMNLPKSSDVLWDQLSAKVRNQVRKGRSHDLQVRWGGRELLGDFYEVFSRNMRDLGTPVYGRRLFEEILEQFAQRAELCAVYQKDRPLACALLLHGPGRTEVPSASSLRQYNGTNANMLMYWHLLERAVQRGQGVFDFGRSTIDSNTFRFKSQWGAHAEPAVWQYYVRRGEVGEMRPDNDRYQRWIRIWQRMPVAFTRIVGPWIVRGIP